MLRLALSGDVRGSHQAHSDNALAHCVDSGVLNELSYNAAIDCLLSYVDLSLA